MPHAMCQAAGGHSTPQLELAQRIAHSHKGIRVEVAFKFDPVDRKRLKVYICTNNHETR